MSSEKTNAEYILCSIRPLMSDLRRYRDYKLANGPDAPCYQVEILERTPNVYRREEFLKSILSLIAALFPRERQVLTMRYVGGMDVSSIAQELGLAQHTVVDTITRARDRLDQRGDIGEIALTVREKMSRLENQAVERFHALYPRVIYKIID